MKNIPSNVVLAAGLFAASLAAQQPTQAQQAGQPGLQVGVARLEIAHIIAVEEQEHDLDKAQRLYRQAMDDKQLSSGARQLATDRLRSLLLRLGKVEQANELRGSSPAKGAVVSLDDVTIQGQDRAREVELRVQARELLEQSKARSKVPSSAKLPGITTDFAEQLLWIGRPAVHAVVAELQIALDIPDSRLSRRTAGLVTFLWRVGGPVASKFLVQCASHQGLAEVAAANSFAIQQLDINDPAVRAYLEHPDWHIARQFLESGRKQQPLVHRIDAAQFLMIAERGIVPMRAFVLREWGDREVDAPQLARLHELARTGLAGTDPDYGNAAQMFLTSTTSQQSIEGLLLLLKQLPDLHRGRIPVAPANLVNVIDAKSVALLVPAIDAAAAAIGPVSADGSSAQRWLRDLMYDVVEVAGLDVASHAWAWWDHGYDLVPVLDGRVTSENAAKLLQRLDKIEPASVDRFLSYFSGVSLPRDLFDLLRDRANAAQGDRRYRLGNLMVATGHEQAAEWVIARWREDERYGPWAKSALLDLGRVNRSQTVRAAMCSMVSGQSLEPKHRTQLVLALMSMGDERVLDLLADGLPLAETVNPYATAEAGFNKLSPLEYLIYVDPESAHGYSEAQVMATAERLLKKQRFEPKSFRHQAIPDPVLVLFATEDPNGHGGGSWCYLVARRLGERIARGEDVSVLESWFLSALGRPGYPHDFSGRLSDEVIERYRDRIAALVDGEDEEWADHAVRELWELTDKPDVERALENRHAKVRVWAADKVRDGDAKVPPAAMVLRLSDTDATVRRLAAEYLGAIVHKDAVPGLIGLLRDPIENVRKVAADSLTRIRFYHEQQAHWERVLKGLDASPASAAEKLLLQAKAGCAQEQRLLAITSLGVLGAPEALPFLIEWTQDADAEVKQAAKAAITQIHLKPRK